MYHLESSDGFPLLGIIYFIRSNKLKTTHSELDYSEATTFYVVCVYGHGHICKFRGFGGFFARDGFCIYMFKIRFSYS